MGSRTPRPVASRLALTGMAVVLLGMSGFAVWASNATKQSLTAVSRLTVLTHDSDAAALALETQESLVREYLVVPAADIKASIVSHSADVASNPSITGTGGMRNLEKIVERHLDTTNVLYMDGHVKSQKLDALNVTNGSGVMSIFTIEND